MPAKLDMNKLEDRITYVSRMYHPEFDLDSVKRRCRAKGCSEHEIAVGIALYVHQQREWEAWRSRYGNPEFGGWTLSPLDGRNKPREVVDQETQSTPAPPCEAQA